MAEKSFDMAVIGSGPGGYVAAIRATQLGFKTCVIEREALGGICLNWGCIPTKALLRTSELFENIKHAENFGISINEVTFDIEKIVERSRGVAKQLSGGVAYLMKKNKIEVIEGEARLLEPRQIAVRSDAGETRIEAKNVIIATGARARMLPGLEPDGERIWTYREAMVPKVMPTSLLVVGSGAIGIEFASFYQALGAEVTVVELMDRVLPVEDEEISKLAHKAFSKQGMTILTGAQVEKLEPGAEAVNATIKGSDGTLQTLDVDRVILAIGITGNIEGLGLEALGVKTDRGHIVIDEWCSTGVDGLYAIGDVVGPPWLAHKASHEGVLCVERIAGIENLHPLDTLRIPGCTYCRPQIASVGLTEAAAREAGRAVKVGRFPFQANGKAIALGEPEGLVKTVFDAATGELLGAHMIGAEVTELIQGFAVAKTLETTEAELIESVFPHPTLSEMMHESVLDAFGRVINF